MENQRQIPFFDYPDLFARHQKEFTDLMVEVLSRGAFIMQKDLENFEKKLAAFLDVKHAVGVADGTVALVMALKSAGLRPGDEVLVPSHTFVASAAAVHHAGGIPVLVDVGEDHLVDPRSVEAAVSPSTRAIMPVHLNGRTCNMEQLQQIADRHGLFIVEDAAQALGAKFKGRGAGTFGVAGTFSFFPAKLLGGFGDGGAVVTNDVEIAEKIRLYRDHGRNREGKTVLWGYNARLDNLQAAVLEQKLAKFPQEIKKRRELAAIYDQRLAGIEELALPPGPEAHPDWFDVFQNYELQAERRDDLMAFLEQVGVKTVKPWGGYTIHQFEGLGFDVDLPNTEKMTSRFLMFPMNTSLSPDDVNHICDKVAQFYGHGKTPHLESNG